MIEQASTTDETAARLRRSALIWASEYYSDETAEHYADWYAAAQPRANHLVSFAQFEEWRGSVARQMYA